MLKAFKVKIYPNKEKAKRINALLAFWQDQVNRKIKIFWEFDKLKGSYSSKEHRKGGRLISDASLRAWQIVKGAKEIKQKIKPHFNGKEIDLNIMSTRIIQGFKTKEFDLWFNVISLEKRQRLKLPAKKTTILNKALEKGNLRKSFKLIRDNGDYYMILLVEFPEAKKKKNKKVVGVDVGLNNAIATSDGKFYGRELKALRIKTKWREYKELSPIKQGLNHYARELIEAYPNCNFAVENLLFKGEKGRSKRFRRRNLNWAYNHLRRQLEQHALLKGFEVFAVNPKHTSQQCPVCGFIARENRQGESFLCKNCGFAGHADTVGAINICRKIIKELPSLRKEQIQRPNGGHLKQTLNLRSRWQSLSLT